MDTYTLASNTLTKSGASWIANRICDKATTPDITVMYLIYSNESTEYIDFNSDFSVDNLNELPSDTWYVRKEGGIVQYSYVEENGTAHAISSGMFNNSDVVTTDSRPTLTSSSRIIATAIGYVDSISKKDVIISASNLSGGEVVKWVNNMSMSVSCPISLSPYPED